MRPHLLLTVPAQLEVDPHALTELRRHLSDEYGATLSLRWVNTLMLAPLALYAGAWGRNEDAELRPLIEAAFFSLEWLELEEAG